jgi:RloB-like protein
MRRRFQRPRGERRYRKLFVLAVEGEKTEPQYFRILDNRRSSIHVKCIKGGHGSSPQKVLERMERHLKEEGLKASDEAWIVIDKDQWTDGHLEQLYDWTRSASNRGLAVSNPKFEYWLLLHFEDGNGIASARDCSDRLRRCLPRFDKGVDIKEITQKRICDAIRRAKIHDAPPCLDWPHLTGTTVYKLVENILAE